MAVARYVSETAVIRMVDEYEATDTKMTVRQGFRIGWSRTSWRLFLINLIVNIPVILLFVVMGVAGFMIYRMVVGGNEALAVTGIVSMIGIVFLIIFVVVIVSIFLGLLRHFFWRVCALEEVGVRESLRRGFAMVRENWKSIGLMWLIMIGLGIAWMIVSVIAIVLTLPVVIITSRCRSSCCSHPWLAPGWFVQPVPERVSALDRWRHLRPALFFTLAFSPWVLLTAWQQVYTSTVWTLTYREIKALPAETPEMEIGPVGD